MHIFHEHDRRTESNKFLHLPQELLARISVKPSDFRNEVTGSARVKDLSDNASEGRGASHAD